MVSGGRRGEVGRFHFVAIDTHVARAYDGLSEARVAVLHFIVVLHGLIAGLVGEAGSVGHEVAVYDFLVHAGTSVGLCHGVVISLVLHTFCVVVVTSQYNFLLYGVHRGKKVSIGFVSRRVDAVRALIDKPFGDGGAFFEECLVSCDSMVFTECSFEQTDSRFEGHSRPFGHAVQFGVVVTVVDRIVDVGHDRVHDELAGVARLFQVGVVRFQRFVIPGYIAKSFYFLEVEIGSEKTCDTIVVLPSYFVVTAMGVFQIEIDFTQVFPVPAPSFGGDCAGEPDRSFG